jgi:Flp pilus assembly protein TadD
MLGDVPLRERARVFGLTAYAHWELGDEAQAASYFHRAYELCPDNDTIVLNQCKGLLIKGAFAEALRLAQDGVQRFATNTTFWSVIVQSQNKLGLEITNVPDEIWQKEVEVALALSLVAQQRKMFAKAWNYITFAQTLEPGSTDLKLFQLSCALDWLLDAEPGRDLIPVDVTSRAALSHAVSVFDSDPNFNLIALESENSRNNLANNLAVAYVILGQSAKAKQLLLETIYRANVCTDLWRAVGFVASQDNDIDFVQQLAPWNRSDVPISALTMMAELALRNWPCRWWPQIEPHLFTGDHVGDDALALDIIRIGVAVEQTQTDSALQQIDQLLLNYPHNSLALHNAGVALLSIGETDRVDTLVTRLSERAWESGSLTDHGQCAELALKAQKFAIAVRHLEAMVKTPQSDRVTKLLLRTYARLHWVTEGLALVAKLPDSVHDDAGFVEAIASLNFQASDWLAAASHFARLTLLEPNNARAWIQTGIALHFAEVDGGQFHASVVKFPLLDDANTEEVQKLALLECKAGLASNALRRIIRHYRGEPSSLERAQAYWSFFVFMYPASQLADEPKTSGPGVVVTLQAEDGSGGQCVILERDPCDGKRLPESICAGETGYSLYSGLTVGSVVLVNGLLGSQNFHVQALCSIDSHLQRQALETIEAAPPHRKLLQKIQLDPDDPKSFLEKVSESLKTRKENFNSYVQKADQVGAPYALRANQLSTDPVWLWLEPSDQPRNTNTGTRDERLLAMQNIAQSSGMVFDVFALTELAYLGLLETVLANVPHPMVDADTVLSFQQALISADDERSVAIASLTEDGLRLFETGTPYQKQRCEFLKSTISSIRKFATVCPVPLSAEFAEVMGDEVWRLVRGPIALAHQTQATLVSEDLFERSLANGWEIPCAWSQPLLQSLNYTGVINDADYLRAVITKLRRNLGWVPLSAKDIITAFRITSTDRELILAALFKQLGSPSITAESLGNVIAFTLLGLLDESNWERVLSEVGNPLIAAAISGQQSAWSKCRNEILAILEKHGQCDPIWSDFILNNPHFRDQLVAGFNTVLYRSARNHLRLRQLRSKIDARPKSVGVR